MTNPALSEYFLLIPYVLLYKKDRPSHGTSPRTRTSLETDENRTRYHRIMGKVAIACAFLFVCMVAADAVIFHHPHFVCHNVPDLHDPHVYYVMDHGVPQRMHCAPGTLYSPITCACGVNVVAGSAPFKVKA